MGISDSEGGRGRPRSQLRILVADELSDAGLAMLRGRGAVEVVVKAGLSESELAAAVGEFDGLLVRSGAKVTAKVLAKPGRLRAIARAGVGVDNIDLDAATAAGVLVMNSAEASTVTTAEHAFALLMALARNIGAAHKRMTEGGWDRNKFVGRQLHGMTLGVVGLGRIGGTVAERALAFGMRVLAFDPVYNAPTAFDGRVRLVGTFDELIALVDAVSFHVPLNDQTRHMLNGQRFAVARPGLLVVNASRGGVIDLAALLAALESGQCGGAALDVFEKEPLEADSPLRKHPKLLLTPHLGASTAEAQEAVSNAACAQLLEYLLGEGMSGAVNVTGVRLDLEPEQLAFVDLAQRMARLVAPLCDGGIGAVTVTCEGEALRSAATTVERAALVELLNQTQDVPVNFVNAKLLAERRGIKVRGVVEGESRSTPMVSLEVAPRGAGGSEGSHRVLGSIFSDGRPRVLQVDGYHMDLVPAGSMVLLYNEDRPGMVGRVGTHFGEAGANIADLVLSRGGGGTGERGGAMMVIKLDRPPGDTLIEKLRATPGILRVASVQLPLYQEKD